MRVPVFFLAAVFAVILALPGLSTSAQAGWRSSILGDSINPPVTLPARTKKNSYGRRSAKRSSGSKKASVARRSQRKGSTGSGRSLRGMASYYWQPQRVAAGGWFNPNALTAAHKTLRFGTRVRVTNLRNGRSVVVRINDRGPYIKGRIIDLSRRAAGIVGMRKSGVAPVRVDIL